MIVVDTSIWIDHIRNIPTPLDDLLGKGRIVLHPFVFGELLLNGLPRKGGLLAELDDLPLAPVATFSDVAAFIGWAKLAGTGIGYVDTHLLVSAKLAQDGKLLTSDKSLRDQAERLDIAYAP